MCVFFSWGYRVPCSSFRIAKYHHPFICIKSFPYPSTRVLQKTQYVFVSILNPPLSASAQCKRVPDRHYAGTRRRTIASGDLRRKGERRDEWPGRVQLPWPETPTSLSAFQSRRAGYEASLPRRHDFSSPSLYLNSTNGFFLCVSLFSLSLRNAVCYC